MLTDPFLFALSLFALSQRPRGKSTSFISRLQKNKHRLYHRCLGVFLRSPRCLRERAVNPQALSAGYKEQASVIPSLPRCFPPFSALSQRARGKATITPSLLRRLIFLPPRATTVSLCAMRPDRQVAKATVCKTVIRRFDSGSGLNYFRSALQPRGCAPLAVYYGFTQPRLSTPPAR
jgi:hypothetical protein